MARRCRRENEEKRRRRMYYNVEALRGDALKRSVCLAGESRHGKLYSII